MRRSAMPTLDDKRRRARRALPAARRPHPARRRSAFPPTTWTGRSRRAAIPLCGLSNHEGPRLEYLQRDDRRDRRRAPRRRTWASTRSATSSGRSQDADDGIPAARQARHLHGRPHRHREGAARRSGARRRAAASTPTTASSTSRRVDRAFLRGELGYLPPDDEWEHLAVRPRLGRPARRRRVADRRHEDPARARARGRAARRRSCARYATVAEEDNDGGGPLLPRCGHVLPGAPPELVPDVVILTEGTGDSKQGRARHLPRPARPHADRGGGHRPLVPRLDAVGGPEPARARRRRSWPRRRGATTPREGFLDHPFLGHGTRTASWAHARHAERLRGARALHVPLRPPAHGRRDAGAGACATSRRSTPCARRARRGCAVEVGGAALRRADLARLPGRTTRRSTWAG